MATHHTIQDFVYQPYIMYALAADTHIMRNMMRTRIGSAKFKKYQVVTLPESVICPCC